jgi:hypothetical protein
MRAENRFGAHSQIAQKQLFFLYRQLARSGEVPKLAETGFRNFSQFDEDGLLLFIFSLLGVSKGLFVDIGAGDGINSNCANLAINWGWHGLFIDGNPKSIARGKEFYRAHPDTWAYPPVFSHSLVTRENINLLIEQTGFSGAVDLLSIDIDGNDYWVWSAIDCISPSVVVIETHIEFGFHDIVVPYDPVYSYPGQHPDYHGASPIAMKKLGNSKGYRLVGTNLYGFNFIFLKNGLADQFFPEISIEQALAHPRNTERFQRFEAIKDFPYVTPLK